MTRHLHAIPGGGGIPGQVRTQRSGLGPITARTKAIPRPALYDREQVEPLADPCAPTVMLAVSPFDVSKLLEALGHAHQAKPARLWVDLAETIRRQRRGAPMIVVDGDPTPAYGTARPGGDAS